MFSALFESFLPSTLACEENQSKPHDISQASTSTQTIDNPDEAQEHKDQLGDKQEAAQEEAEEEEELQDQGDVIRAACGETKVCKSFMHHLEECGKRLEEGKTMVENETCVEELFHYMHCVDDCAAPKIFAALK
ncbi:hypothetical protein JCM8097_001802 [Rhodosporidiobolus ruineniae]